MANIDNLNFEVILKDEEFKRKVGENMELAKQLNTSLSELLDLQAKLKQSGIKVTGNGVNDAIKQERLAAATAQRAAAEERLRTAQTNTRAASERLATAANNRAAAEQRAVTATANSIKAQKSMMKAVTDTNRVAKNQSRIFSELKGMALSYLSIRGVSSFVSSLVRITGEFELQKTTLAAMLGDLNKAESIMSNIKDLAVQSPFTFGELSTYAKQLSAFSVPAKELYETTKMLADISAGLGVGMDRIVLAYGQVRSAAFLRGQEVRQFIEAGIPILDELAKQFTELEGRAVSAGEVFDKISARLVPFEMVAKVLQDLTSEGGKFYEMQSIQSETLKGKVLKLKDAYQIMLNEIGEAKSDKIKGTLDGVINLMKNWEKMGNIIVTVVATLGAYKAAMMLITAGQWVRDLYKTIDAWRKLNATLQFLNLNTIKLGEGLASMGISTKMMASAAVGAVAALVAIIARAVKNANELKKELDGIVSAELSGSNKTVDKLDNLVLRLKSAKQGSQEYRDAISELNRKYGEYLPKVFSEADAYSQVEAAANAAAEAIRNKAKASAFDKGTEAIEEKYGKELTETGSALEAALFSLDPTIPKKVAIEFLKGFKKNLTLAGDEADAFEVFEKAYTNFFGEGRLASLFELADFRIADFSENFKKSVENYGDAVSVITKEQGKLNDQLELRFGDSSYSSYKEMQGMVEIEEWYNKELSTNNNSLQKRVMTQEEYNKAVADLDLKKLEKQAELYESLGRDDLAKGIREQIAELTKVPEGWRGKVQDVLKEMGLTKGTSFGLWAEDTTQSTSYVEDMIKRYKELKDEIKWVSTFDTDQADRLKKNKEAIEKVAKALNIDIVALSAGKGKSKAQEEIEAQIDGIKKLQDAYEKLRPFLNEAQMKSTLKTLFPNVSASIVDSLDFNTELERLATKLAVFDKEAAARLRNSISKDVAGAMANSFKAVEEYRKALDAWKNEDFNLEGKGIAFDISKIVSDLENSYATIEKKRLKNLELLADAQRGDEEALKKVREVYGEEAWQTYITQGKSAIEELAKGERAASQKTANEKIRDLAQKFVSEKMSEKNIDTSNLEDKTIQQVKTLVERLRELINEANKAKGDILADIMNGDIQEGQMASFEMLSKVVDILGIKIEDLGIEIEKKLVDKIKDGLKAVGGLGSQLENLGKGIEMPGLESIGKEISRTSEEISSIIEAGEAKDTIALIANILSMVVSRWADYWTAAYQEQVALNDAIREYADIQNELRRDSHTNIFGTDEMALAAENLKILSEAQDRYTSSLDEFNKIKVQSTDARAGNRTWDKTSLGAVMEDISKGQGWDLYLENGELNIDAVEAYYDAYSNRLSKKQKDLIEQLIADGKAVEDAAAKQAEYITSLFSNAADEVASKMVDAFIETGDAATDLGDIVGNVAKEMAADLIRSLYMKDVLDKYNQEIEAIQANEGLSKKQKTLDSLSALDKALAEINARSGLINETLADFSQYWEGTEMEGQNLADGIKGITEDTANLLASYLNAIRSDVSQMRVLQALHLPIISAAMPTIMDHLAQINAHTYDTSMNTQSMLTELISINNKFGDVIGSGSEGYAIKVLM